MAIESLRDVFRHLLAETYHAEQLIVGVLNEVELETSSPVLRDRIRESRLETLRHIANVERCFELVGTSPPRLESGIVRGITADRRAFASEHPTPASRDAFNLLALERIARYMLASYRQLGRLAAALGAPDVATLLDVSAVEKEAVADWASQTDPLFMPPPTTAVLAG